MPAAAVAGVAAVGGGVLGYMGNKAQADAAKKASKAQNDATMAGIDLQREMYNQARSDYSPYRQVGQNAIPLYNQLTRERDQGTQNALQDYQNYQGQRLPGSNLSVNLANPNQYTVDTNIAKVDPNNYNAINTKSYALDPSQYQADSSNVINFQMDPTDSVYKWKQDQAQKNVAQNMAAAGLSGSKYGMSLSQDANMRVAADEANSQFNREMQKYGVLNQQQSDLYGRTADQNNLQYARDYTKESDLYNRTSEQNAMDWQRQYQQQSDLFNRTNQNALTGYQVQADNYNRAYQNATYADQLRMNQLANAFNMNKTIADTDYSKALDALKIGAGAAGTSGQWAMGTGQTGAQMLSGMGVNNANAINAAGNATAGMYGGIANTGMNALAMYYMYGNRG